MKWTTCAWWRWLLIGSILLTCSEAIRQREFFHPDTYTALPERSILTAQEIAMDKHIAAQVEELTDTIAYLQYRIGTDSYTLKKELAELDVTQAMAAFESPVIRRECFDRARASLVFAVTRYVHGLRVHQRAMKDYANPHMITTLQHLRLEYKDIAPYRKSDLAFNDALLLAMQSAFTAVTEATKKETANASPNAVYEEMRTIAMHVRGVKAFIR